MFLFVLYLFYFAPLGVAVHYALNDDPQVAGIIVLVVALLHNVVGAIVGCMSNIGLYQFAIERYSRRLPLVADILVEAAWIMAIFVIVNPTVDLALVTTFVAIVGNLFCYLDNFFRYIYPSKTFERLFI